MITPLRHTPLLPGTLQNLFYPPREYKYFEHAGKVPFRAAASVAKAAWASDASMLAYARFGERRMTDEELSGIFEQVGLDFEKIGGSGTDWNAPGTQALFAHCKDFAFMSFRGTERDDPIDILADANIALAHEPDYRPVAGDPAPALAHLNLVTHLFADVCFVHRGFQLALNQVWERVHSVVMAYRESHPGAEVCFTGHSLGAALAVLAFGRFADLDISLYTFGCPRVGDGAFRDRIASNPGRGIYRYVNENDAVAHVPTDSLLYRQTPAGCYRFSQEGNLDVDDGCFHGDVESLRAAITGLPVSLNFGDLDQIPAPPSLVDHSPARYCFRLWDCVEID